MSTTAGYAGKTVTRHGEPEAHQNASDRESMFGEMPGEIIEFDPATQKAMIQPLYKPRHDDGNGNLVAIDLPVLEEVPVRFDRCLHGRLTYPLMPGDRVQLRPQMRATERFHTEDVHIATDVRSYSLSDLEAYVDGGESLINPIQNFDPENMHLGFDGETGMFGLHGSIIGQMKIDLISGELMQMLITTLTALAAENTLTNTATYSSVLAQLTAAKLP